MCEFSEKFHLHFLENKKPLFFVCLPLPEGVGKVLEGRVLIVDVGDGNVDGGGATLPLLILSHHRLNEL